MEESRVYNNLSQMFKMLKVVKSNYKLVKVQQKLCFLFSDFTISIDPFR